VVDLKLNFAPMLKHAGVNVESVSVGKHALMDSWFTDVTCEQKRWSDSHLDRCDGTSLQQRRNNNCAYVTKKQQQRTAC